jgi:hypothetical protein
MMKIQRLGILACMLLALGCVLDEFHRQANENVSVQGRGAARVATPLMPKDGLKTAGTATADPINVALKWGVTQELLNRIGFVLAAVIGFLLLGECCRMARSMKASKPDTAIARPEFPPQGGMIDRPMDSTGFGRRSSSAARTQRLRKSNNRNIR